MTARQIYTPTYACMCQYTHTMWSRDVLTNENLETDASSLSMPEIIRYSTAYRQKHIICTFRASSAPARNSTDCWKTKTAFVSGERP